MLNIFGKMTGKNLLNVNMRQDIINKINSTKKTRLSKKETMFLLEYTQFLPQAISIPKRLWYFKNNQNEILTCQKCLNEPIWHKSQKLYKKLCHKCLMSSDEIKEKRKQTNLKKFGVNNVFANNDIKRKIENTKISRYNDKNYSNREQFKKTCIAKYNGIGYSSKQILNKIQKTNLTRYGDFTYSNRIKCMETNLKKYGVKYQFLRPETRILRNLQYSINNPLLEMFKDKKKLSNEYINNTIQDISRKYKVCEKTVLNYLHFHNISIKYSGNYSNISICWLNFISQNDNIFIRHAENQGEYKIPETKYKVDGYCEETNTVYEFLGDFWHGNLNVYDPICKNSLLNVSFNELYHKTMDRLYKIQSLGYNIVYIWENDWNNFNINIKSMI